MAIGMPESGAKRSAVRMSECQAKRIVVGMSGGVDSSVALLLLKKQGWEPVGVSLELPVWKNPCNELRENACCTSESFANARKVCEKLGVPHYIYDVKRSFERKVIGYFISELSHCRTPNPCLICNRELKIRKLFEWAKRHGIRHVATGHYAKIKIGVKGEACLERAEDGKKDQAYGLCLLPRAWLPKLVLPLGSLTKQQVYEIAIKEGLGFFAQVRQSQDLCFVSGKAMKQFIREKIGKREGEIIDDEGKKVGTHQGLYSYTIGQRHGLGLPFTCFVKCMDAKRNALVVTRERKKLLGREFIVERFNWLCKKPQGKFQAAAQIRSGQREVKVCVVQEKGKLRIVCDAPVEGITPGQICALYKGRRCIGGGRIMRALSE